MWSYKKRLELLAEHQGKTDLRHGLMRRLSCFANLSEQQRLALQLCFSLCVDPRRHGLNLEDEALDLVQKGHFFLSVHFGPELHHRQKDQISYRLIFLEIGYQGLCQLGVVMLQKAT